MPSASRTSFQRHLLRDVDQLRIRHRNAHPGQQPGRPSSDLTRSGVFLLCAAWEWYTEEVILEAFQLVLAAANAPLTLPKPVRTTLAKAVKHDKHELAVLQMAGEGWRTYLSSLATAEVASLNTPNKTNLDDLFDRFVGVDTAAFLAPHENALRVFISKRGDIAHRGREAGHVSINDLDADYDFICGLVRDLDNFLIEALRPLIGRRPWNRRE